MIQAAQYLPCATLRTEGPPIPTDGVSHDPSQQPAVVRMVSPVGPGVDGGLLGRRLLPPLRVGLAAAAQGAARLHPVLAQPAAGRAAQRRRLPPDRPV